MITVYTTVPDQEEAKRIAHTLVEERFAACVNTHEVESVYRWKGEIIDEGEVALDVKTTRDFTEIEEKIIELHPYDVPAVLCFNVDSVYEDYEDWVDESSG